MGNKKKNKNKKVNHPADPAVVQAAEAVETAPEPEANDIYETDKISEALAALAEETTEEAKVEIIETPEVIEAAAEADNAEDTKILTEDMKEALADEEETGIVDAKIRAGINEAAEDFRMEQELVNTGNDIAKAVGQQKYKTDWNSNQTAYNSNYMEDIRTMENKNREEQEVKTVYVQEKQKTGWWKIVMLILTIIIAFSFSVTAVLGVIGIVQLSRIEENQVAAQAYAGGGYDLYEYGCEDGSCYDNDYGYGNYGGNSGYGSYYGYNGSTGSGYGNDEDIYEYYYGYDDDDLSNYFSEGQPSGNNGSDTISDSDLNEIFEWFADIFGESDGSNTNGGNTNGGNTNGGNTNGQYNYGF